MLKHWNDVFLALTNGYHKVVVDSSELRVASLAMMTSSNGKIFRITGLLRGEYTGLGEIPAQRPVMRSFDVFFDLCLNNG